MDDDDNAVDAQVVDPAVDQVVDQAVDHQVVANDYFKPYGQEDQCDFNPEFAVICSFIQQFGDKIDLSLNIDQLQTSIEDQSELNDGLIDLHVKLLKKVRRYFVRDQWEKALIRFAAEYSYEDAYEIELLGYLKTRPSIKLQLLRRLLEAQFEFDPKFKASVNLCEATELRLLPTGRDIRGNTYWHRSDQEGIFKIFQDDPLDFRSWKAICSNPAQLNELIERLETTKDDEVKGKPILEPYNPLPEIFPEYFKQSDINKVSPIPEEANSEDATPNNKKISHGGRRGRCRGKKSVPLLSVKEEDENARDGQEFKGLSNIETTIPNEALKELTSNRLTENAYAKILPLESDCATLESQVMATLETLIGKVVSSFGNFIRPVSRNSNNGEEKVGLKIANELPTKKQPQKRQPKKVKISEESLPRRSSSRIQQLQQKKVAEQEEEMKKKMIESIAKPSSIANSSPDEDSRSRTSSKNIRRRSESPEEASSKNRKRRRKGGQTWRRGKAKKKLSWDKDDSDLSSISSATQSDENEDFEDADESFKLDIDDDEFACEDEETNIEPVIIKRARTARQSVGTNEPGDLNSSSILEEDKPCRRCDGSNDPEWILLCDECDDGYHTSCCLPPLMVVPDGDWFCPPCEHKKLLVKFREIQANINQILAAKELELKKRQRLRQDNVKKEPIKSEPAEKLPEKRQRISAKEFNDPIALQEFEDELRQFSDADSSSSFETRPKNRKKKLSKPAKAPRRKPTYERDNEFSLNYKRSRKTYSRREQTDSDESEEEDDDVDQTSEMSDEIRPKARRARASVSYRFQEYDELIKSAILGESYDEEEEEESEKESSTETGNYGRGKDMATIEALAYQQENGIMDQAQATPALENLDIPKRPKIRKKAKRLNDLDASSETEGAGSDESFQAPSASEAEDEDEDEDLTEEEFDSESASSLDELVVSTMKARRKPKKKRDYYSDDSDYQPRGSRRAASKKISYKESTDEEEEDSIAVSPQKTKKLRLSSDDESQASWKSDPTSVIEEDERSTSCADSADLGNEDPSIDDELEPAIETVTNHTHQIRGSMDDQQVNNLASMKINNLNGPSNVILSRQKQVPEVESGPNVSVNDEIAEPLINQRKSIGITLEPRPTAFAIRTTPVQIPRDAPSMMGVDQPHDPIGDLSRFCSESVSSTAMFNSYNVTLSSKPAVSSPVCHPPFYDDSEQQNPSLYKQTQWNPTN